MIDIEELIKELKGLNNFDEETAHVIADDLLCQLLRELGHDDVVEAYLLVDKWYA
jgi:hypothetical protein